MSTANADGPSWQRRDWPVAANGELVSALDGQWPEVSAIAVKAGKAVVKEGEDRRRARDARRRACRRRATPSAPS